MSAREAAIQVLSEAGEPLHSDEIRKRILARRLWITTGKTPCATVEAQICTDMQKKGAASPFVRTAPRTFALRADVPTLPDAPVPAKEPTPRPSGGLSFREAAEKVLNAFGNKSPMHYRAITETAITEGWLATAGKTPPASMYSQLITEIRRDKSHGRFPRFVQHGKGYFGLSKWMGGGWPLKSSSTTGASARSCTLTCSKWIQASSRISWGGSWQNLASKALK